MAEPMNGHMPNMPSSSMRADPTPKEFFEAQLRMILGVQIRGCIGTYRLPAPVMLPMLAEIWGGMLMATMAGDAGTKAKIREQILARFQQGAFSVSLEDKPQPEQPQPEQAEVS